MKYFFESVVEKKEKGYMIQIPFNVWEVCKQRDVIKGEVILDNKLINCELLPKEKGNYEIHIGDEDAVSVELGVPHKIVLHITGSLIRMDQNSPYSVENPIRKIDSINVIIPCAGGDGLDGHPVDAVGLRTGQGWGFPGGGACEKRHHREPGGGTGAGLQAGDRGVHRPGREPGRILGQDKEEGYEAYTD